MNVQCVECMHFDLREAGPRLARYGLGRCLVIRREVGTLMTSHAPRTCPSFRQALPERVDARRAYLSTSAPESEAPQ